RALGVKATHQPMLKAPDEEAVGASSCIIFHPWATGDRAFLREWGRGQWLELAKKLSAGDTTFMITGTSQEMPRSEELARLLRRAGLSAEVFIINDGLT